MTLRGLSRRQGGRERKGVADGKESLGRSQRPAGTHGHGLYDLLLLQSRQLVCSSTTSGLPTQGQGCPQFQAPP